jgi:hypothetical protein
VAKDKKIVIGTPADLAAFTQWRAVISQANLLTNRAQTIASTFTGMGPYNYVPPVPISTVTNLTPNSATAGSGFTLTVSGAGFMASSVVLFNGVRVDTAFVSPSQLTATVPSNLVANAGTASVAVLNPSQAGAFQISNSLNFTINARPAGAARILGAAPPAAAAGAAPATAATTPTSALTAVTGAIPTFVQLAQFLATAFAVNQTLGPYQGAMTDAPLINMVARQLRYRAGNSSIYVPSVYTPTLLRGYNLEGTYLWNTLSHLETARMNLATDIGTYSQYLSQANFVTQNPKFYSDDALGRALAYSAQAQSLLTSAQNIATSIDAFEASLFGGQAAQSQPASQNSTSQNSASPSGTQSQNTQSNPAGNTGAGTPATGFNANSLNAANAPAPAASQAATPATGQAGNILPQILGSDWLAQQIWGVSGDQAPGNAALDSVDFLTVHALESGGTQLNKTNIFYGTHVFFSGGSVMTFSLYASTGDLKCSGFAYDYRGNVREKNYESVLRAPLAHDAILNTDFACGDSIK